MKARADAHIKRRSKPREPSLRQLQQRFAQELLGSGTSSCEFIKPSTTLSASERLEVYRRNTRYSLRRSLERTYVLTRRVLGDTCFGELSRAYLRHYPSTSRSLNDYGQQLESFLRRKAASLGIPKARAKVAVQAAALDWTIAQVEQSEIIKFSGLPTFMNLPSAQQTTASLSCIPSLRLLRLDYPLDRLRRRINSSPRKVSETLREHTRCSPIRATALRAGICLSISISLKGLQLRRVEPDQLLLLKHLLNRRSNLGSLLTYAKTRGIDLPNAFAGLVEAGEVWWPELGRTQV
jgi:hypothetical protein